METISLFTGAGGLDIGLEAAGFRHIICVDIDKDARLTLHQNRPHWQLLDPGDIHLHKPEEILDQAGLRPKEAILLSAGPPCQPFSKASFWANGKAKGLADVRSKTLKAYIKMAEVALPQTLLLENVMAPYKFGKNNAIKLLELGVDWINRRKKTRYKWNIFRLNAADYGVPQARMRVYFLADRDGRIFKPPLRTHGPNLDNEHTEQYYTAWDAIGDLDNEKWDENLAPRGKWASLLPSIPEGNNYLWHTDRGGGKSLFGWRTRYWSFLLKLAKDKPSWTLAANPGPATGPFHWRNRLLSIKELCRLQTFPDEYKIQGLYSYARRQIGNAVPPLIGEILGKEICRQWLDDHTKNKLHFIPSRRDNIPKSYPLKPVPKEYYHLIRKHDPHPGVGRGPRTQFENQKKNK